MKRAGPDVPMRQNGAGRGEREWLRCGHAWGTRVIDKLACDSLDHLQNLAMQARVRTPGEDCGGAGGPIGDGFCLTRNVEVVPEAFARWLRQSTISDRHDF